MEHKKIVMDGYKRECKLCDKIVSDENYDYEVIEDATKSVFDVLLPKLTLDNDTQDVMCSMCSSKLHAASNFKSTCLHTDNILISYFDFENPKLLDLKEVYAKEKVRTGQGRKFDNREICRLCLHTISGDVKLIQEVSIDTIEIYIPEINFTVSTNPLICIKCYDALCVHSSFLKNCLEVEKKRKIVTMDLGDIFLSGGIKTEEIAIKVEQIDDAPHSDKLSDLEKQENEEAHNSLDWQNDLVGTVENKSLYHLEDLKPTSADSSSGNYESEEEDPLDIQLYECSQCSYKTERKFNLKTHQLIHKDDSEIQMYDCGECSYKTKTKGHLKRHKLTHKDVSEIKMYECSQCSYKAKRMGNLRTHELIHKDPSAIQMYGCSQCGYETRRKDCLKTHQLTHRDPSELQMHECNECSYKCKLKSSLRSHRLTHKQPSEMRMYECSQCDYKTKTNGHLKAHQLTHKNPSEIQMYDCSRCSYKSKTKRSLKRHQLTHQDPSKIQMFACRQCKFITKHKWSLVSHQSTHKDPSEILMHECSRCSYKTRTKSSLKRHQLTHKEKINKNCLKNQRLKQESPSE